MIIQKNGGGSCASSASAAECVGVLGKVYIVVKVFKIMNLAVEFISGSDCFGYLQASLI